MSAAARTGSTATARASRSVCVQPNWISTGGTGRVASEVSVIAGTSSSASTTPRTTPASADGTLSMDAICLRILSCFPQPLNLRMLSTWLSPDDAGRLFEASLTAERPGFRVAFGVSANTRGGWVSLDEARALGYQPEDDAEAFAAELIAEHGEPDPDDPVLRRLGGEFTLPDDQVPCR